jgi:hypothetical protein
MQADMMHDAMRADVLASMLASNPAAGVDPRQRRASPAWLYRKRHRLSISPERIPLRL